jgi:hypothetical protein
MNVEDFLSKYFDSHAHINRRNDESTSSTEVLLMNAVFLKEVILLC